LRERLEARLAPSSVVLRRLSRGARPRELTRYDYEVSAGENTRDWQPAVALAHLKIRALGWRSMDLDIVLTGDFTRLAVLPWTAAITERDAAAYALHQFRSIYGDSVDDWTLSLGVARPGCPRVAAAVDRALIEGLRAEAAEHDLRLRSVRPLLAALLDSHSAKDLPPTGWVALLEPRSVLVAGFTDGNCVDVRSARCTEDRAKVLLALLHESALITDCAAEEGGQLRLYAADAPDCSELREHGWRVTTARSDFA
jgi:hypothetical protein